MINTKRLDELFEMGLRFNGQEYQGEINGMYINFHHTEILCDTDEQWKTKVDAVKDILKKSKS